MCGLQSLWFVFPIVSLLIAPMVGGGEMMVAEGLAKLSTSLGSFLGTL